MRSLRRTACALLACGLVCVSAPAQTRAAFDKIVDFSVTLKTLSAAAAGQDGAKLIEESGIHGGVVVHLGCGDGDVTAQLAAGPQYVVLGLDTDMANVSAARRRLLAEGRYGKVAIDHACEEARRKNQPRFQVDFHGGGEPTIEWGTLKELTEYARSRSLPSCSGRAVPPRPRPGCGSSGCAVTSSCAPLRSQKSSTSSGADSARTLPAGSLHSWTMCR